MARGKLSLYNVFPPSVDMLKYFWFLFYHYYKQNQITTNYFFNSIHLGPSVTTAAPIDIPAQSYALFKYRLYPRRDTIDVFVILVVTAKLTSTELHQASPTMLRSFYFACNLARPRHQLLPIRCVGNHWYVDCGEGFRQDSVM